MELFNSVGPCNRQNFVTALKFSSSEVIGREILELQIGPGSAVVDQYPFTKGRKVGVAGRWARERGVRCDVHCLVRLPVPPRFTTLTE